MTKKEEFFEDMANAIDSWTDAATKAVTEQISGLTWGANKDSFKHIRQVLLSHDVPKEVVEEMFSECFQGLAHSFLCTLDGATALSDTGRIYVVDEDGNELGDGLHGDFAEYFFDRKESKEN